MDDTPKFEQYPKSPDNFEDAAPEQLTGRSQTVAVRGMQRAVEQTRQLLLPIDHNTE